MTRPELSVSLAGTSPFGYGFTNTLCYAGGQSGVLTATALLTDPTSGLAQVAFPDTTGYGASYGLSGAINGTRSHSYDFDAGDTFSATVSIIATDRANNVITQPVAVIRDTTPPTVTFHLPDVAPLRFTVAWTADDKCGVRHYDVAYKQGAGGTWTGWLTATTQTEAVFQGQSNQVYYFRIRATDNACTELAEV